MIYYPVLDETGLEGAWDFTLNYGLMLNLPARVGAPPVGTAPGVPSDPAGIPSFTEAVEKQLGLKAVTRKRMVPVLVIDHIEEKPTEN
jgi:uncharacterized protein (TIGR03435 family)